MNYIVTIQSQAFQEIENAYRWLCDNTTPDIANNWYNELQTAIESYLMIREVLRSDQTSPKLHHV